MTVTAESPTAGNGGALENSSCSAPTTGNEPNTLEAAIESMLGDTPRSGPSLAAMATGWYIAVRRADGTLCTMAPLDLVDGLLNTVNAVIGLHNERFNPKRDRSGPLTVPSYSRLGMTEVAALIMARHLVVQIAPSEDAGTDPDRDLLAVYDDNPESARYGTYVADEATVRRMGRLYSPDLSVRHDLPELMFLLRDMAPRVFKGTDRDLIPVANGIFNYRTKELRPFDPEHVFMAKLTTRYVPGATNPVIANPEGCIPELHVGDPADPCTPACTTWDVETWVASLADDQELVALLWEVIGAVCRPYVSWNKGVFFYAENGNNGKGTLLQLMRNLIGSQAYVSLKLVDFGKEFALEGIVNAMAILTDENDVGGFIDKAANIKALVTHDALVINRKFKSSITYRFDGLMIQCLNEKPRVRDNSNSFWRRVLAIPFEKNFEFRERKYIKDDYLKRREVLEYVLHRVLHTDYYEFSTPEATEIALEGVKEFNDPVRRFWDDLSDEFAWELLPFQFLYDLFVAWMRRNHAASTPLGRNKFIDTLLALLAERHGQGRDLQWRCDDRKRQVRSAGRMSAPELLIGDYDLTNWVNRREPASDRRGRSTPHPADLKEKYCGLQRPTLPPAVQAALGLPGSADPADEPRDLEEGNTDE